jgi:hypothetical protein
MTRQDIYDAVWASPLTEVAARLKLSPGTLRTACNAAEVPVPGRGHWVRASIGKAPSPPSLPGNRNERMVLRKGELAMHETEQTSDELAASESLSPQKAGSVREVSDLMGVQLQVLEAASQRWVREQQLLAFLAQVLAGTTQLPPQAGRPASGDIEWACPNLAGRSRRPGRDHSADGGSTVRSWPVDGGSGLACTKRSRISPTRQSVVPEIFVGRGSHPTRDQRQMVEADTPNNAFRTGSRT